jgi:hypothetical protein
MAPALTSSQRQTMVSSSGMRFCVSAGGIQRVDQGACGALLAQQFDARASASLLQLDVRRSSASWCSDAQRGQAALEQRHVRPADRAAVTGDEDARQDWSPPGCRVARDPAQLRVIPVVSRPAATE